MKILRWLLLSSLLLCTVGKVFFHSGFPYTHDGENHLARFANYALAIREGQFPPRLAPNLLNHFTYPVFNYNYPLANILSLPGSVLKINYEVTFKIIALTAIISLGIGVDLWLASTGFSSSARWLSLAGLFSTPFLINTIWFRGNIGELSALALIPWVFWLIEKWRTSLKISWQNLFFLGLTLVAVALAHNIGAIMIFPTVLGYAALRLKSWQKWISFTLVWLWAILATLWFWLPALMEKSLIVLDQAKFFQEYARHFATWSELFFAPLQFGFSVPGSVDTLSFNLGLVTTISIILVGLKLTAEHLILRQIKKNNTDDGAILIAVLTVCCLGLIWLETSSSWWFWQFFKPLSYVQFPWRLTLLITILVLPLTASLLDWAKQTQQRWLKLTLGLVVILSWWPVSQLKAVDYFHRTNQDYEAFSQTTSTLNENLPKQFTYQNIAEWQPTPQLLSGSGTISVQKWRGSHRFYTLDLTESATIVEPSIIFAGFETTANHQKVEYVDNDVVKGRLAYVLPQGHYLIETKFTQNTWPRIIGNSLSIMAFLGAGVWLWLQTKKSS
jgi:hypothetical protein